VVVLVKSATASGQLNHTPQKPDGRHTAQISSFPSSDFRQKRQSLPSLPEGWKKSQDKKLQDFRNIGGSVD